MPQKNNSDQDFNAVFNLVYSMMGLQVNLPAAQTAPRTSPSYQTNHADVVMPVRHFDNRPSVAPRTMHK